VELRDPRDQAVDRFPLFDSLRAIAALSIVAFHVSAAVPPGPGVEPYFARLKLGVALFFLISGFLLYRPFVAARVGGSPRPRTGPYSWRRFLRIVPGYWVALTVTALWFGMNAVFSADGVFFYGFAQIYRPDIFLQGIGQAWTLCVEVTFYAFLPLWALLMSRVAARTRRARVQTELVGLALLGGASILYKELVLFDHGDGPGPPALAFALPRYLDQFAIGMALAVVSVALTDRPLPRWMRPVERFPGLSWAMAGVTFWFSATQVGHAAHFGEVLSPGQNLTYHLVAGVVAFWLILPAVFGDQRRGILRRVLANRVLLWIGTVSYGVYLWHTAVVSQFHDWHLIGSARGVGNFSLWMLAVTAATLAIAALSYYAVERPALRLKRAPASGAASRVARAGKPLAIAAAALLAGVAVFDAAPLPALLCLAAAGLAVWLALVPARRPVWGGRTRPGLALATLGAAGAGLSLLALFVGPPGLGKPGVAPRGAALPAVEHVAATYDGRDLRLYVDGKLAKAGPVGRRADAPRGPVEIGAYAGGGRWNGAVDEVAFYDAALGPDQIAHHDKVGRAGRPGDYDRELGSTPSLVGRWRLGRGDTAARASDSAGSATGTYEAPRTAAPPLVAGTSDGAALFDGKYSGVAIPAVQVTKLRRAFTIEAWVQPRAYSSKHVIGAVGAFYLKTDPYGRWSAGMTTDGRDQSLVSTVDARRPGGPADLGAPATKPSPDPALLALLGALTLIAAGALRSIGIRQRPSAAPPAVTRGPDQAYASRA
jgi:peptidoglycan/LPS O-acetylase OafA/YrhL